jgi:hypothetical protein
MPGLLSWARAWGVGVVTTSGRARSTPADRAKSRDVSICGIPAGVVQVVHEGNTVHDDVE